MIPEQDEISEQEWLVAMSSNSAFDFLHDEAEDVYSITDGELVSDIENNMQLSPKI